MPWSQTSAELLFEVFTSNLPFDELTSVFGSERLTVTAQGHQRRFKRKPRASASHPIPGTSLRRAASLFMPGAFGLFLF